MSDLAGKGLEMYDRWDSTDGPEFVTEMADALADEARAARIAVVALHQRGPTQNGGLCATCGVKHPCPTIRALERME